MKKSNKGKTGFLKLEKVFFSFVYVLPFVLFFSYYPLIHFGADSSMNFEISLPIIWLVLFDILAVLIMAKRKILFCGIKKRWMWLLFPLWLTVSVFWSANFVRGILTAGIVWLLYFAVYAIFSLKEMFDKEFSRKWWKWFLGSAIFVCVWCFVQCLLDLVGVSREYSLMCEGCTYQMFGFPHPNGFAIEPQFMGNLLLAPAIVAAWLYVEGNCNKTNNDLRFLCSNSLLFCLFIITATLFLTFSRGAIYAFVVGMIFMTAFLIAKDKNILKRAGMVWLVVVFSFLFTLNLQGLMAELSPTNDNYQSGVAKVLNHLSLGVIDVRDKKASFSGEEQALFSEITGEEREVGDSVVVENPVENFDEKDANSAGDAVFDGYVAESTDIRLRLSGAAVDAWRKNVTTVLVGVGIGGAGQALYSNGLSSTPKEIVQNQYSSLLLETGLVGVSLFALTMVLVFCVVWKNNKKAAVLSMIVSYGIALLFFSGLPNALHIYLLPVVIMAVPIKFLSGKS